MREKSQFKAVSKAGLTDQGFNALSSNAERENRVRHHVQQLNGDPTNSR